MALIKTLHLKACEGDLLLITEPALLTRCVWQSHVIYPAALIFVCLLITKFKVDEGN